MMNGDSNEMAHYDRVRSLLGAAPRRFLVTGVAGFIGSHLLEALLKLGQSVVGLDNFTSGTRGNLHDVMSRASPDAAARFRMIEGDIRDPAACKDATRGVQVVLHQAGLASVPRSLETPLEFHSVNVNGFLNVLFAAQTAGAQRLVYASSSAVYGDDASATKAEDRIGRPLSPYGATKLIDEVYAATFRRTLDVSSVGLRYFNVYGPRQDPTGAYAAVIPRWIEKLFRGEQCVVFGDGSATRDFCYVDDVVQANTLAACVPQAAEAVFNVGTGASSRLLELFELIRRGVAMYEPTAATARLQFLPARAGDVPHSLASIARAREMLGYDPACDLARGIRATIDWYGTRASRAHRVGAAVAPLDGAAVPVSGPP